MNHTYRLVWNQETQRYVPAPECARGQSKTKSKTKALAPAAVLLSAAFAMPVWAQAPPANALPTGGKVTAGQATISQNSNQMTVGQGSQKAIIDWTSFNIGKNAGVTFQQPNANAIALNRVSAGDASQIHGQLNANGQVWLINPNGVVFGAGSKVDVGGLVASTMNIANDDFLNGKHTFNRNGATGSIVNQGEITAKDGGSIALLAPTVSNDGIVTARLGSVVMAAGDKITLQAGANGLLNVEIDPATFQTLVENKQLIVADGGQVIMTGKAADQLAASVVSNSGTIQANSLQERDGKILLIADMQHGETQAAGTLQAKFIDTSAATVSIDKNLKIDTNGGEWLIDPVDITIDQNKATAIETALGTGDVTVSTENNFQNPWHMNGHSNAAGDIHVSADITYDQNKLTLNANNNIYLKASITVNFNGTLALNYGGTAGDVNATPAAGSSIHANFGYGYSGGFAGKVNFEKVGTGLLSINGVDYTVIQDIDSLQTMTLGGHYALGGDIHAGSTSGWNGGQGFNPIGDSSNPFTGTFDGLGHTINDLTINRPETKYVGLFGETRNATLRNVGLEGVSVTGHSHTGALAGGHNATYSGSASIHNAYAIGQVSGLGATGGLVGDFMVLSGSTSTLRNVYTVVDVQGSRQGVGMGASVGGLLGGSYNSGGGRTEISDAYATGNVQATGGSSIGGLVGTGFGDFSIRNAYASGQVQGADSVGGLVGRNEGSISNTYATGAVTLEAGGAKAGGLVGNNNSGSVTASYYATTGQDGNAINQGGSTNGAWSGNANGTAQTRIGLTDASLYNSADGWGSAWDLDVVTGLGSLAWGYEVGRLPSLTGVTRAQDVQAITLFAGGMGTAGDAWRLNNWQQLQAINYNTDTLTGHYVLTADLSSSTADYGWTASSTANGGLGFKPIGDASTNSFASMFSGTFDGQGHTIAHLTIRSSNPYVGLFGYTSNATLRNVGLVDASVTGTLGYDRVGGLVGYHYGGSITQAYVTGNVAGTGNGSTVGALAGASEGDITLAYATGSVKGGYVGGLVGVLYSGGSIRQAYATGRVQGNLAVGGLVGSSAGSVAADSFYATTDESGASINNSGSTGILWSGNANGTAKTRAELQQLQTFADAGWDIDDQGGTGKSWRIYEGHSGPLLRSFLTPITVTATTADLIGVTGKTYDGSAASVSVGNYTTNVLNATLDGSLHWASSSKNAGTYSTANGGLKLGGLHSGQQGYDIRYVPTGANASLTIARKALSVADTIVAGRAYNGSTDVLAQTSAGHADVVAGDAVTLGISSATLDSKNAGNRSATVTYALTGSDAANYTVGTSTHSVAIGKASLAISAVADSKTYDGSAASARTDLQVAGLAAGDTLTGLGQTFDSRHAGDRTLTVNGGYTLADGNGGGNYTVTTHSASGSIAKANITIGADAVRKTYDGTTAATGTAQVTGGTLAAGDSISGGSFAFADKNAGQNKTVTVSGVTVNDGNYGGNYHVIYADNTASTIDRAALTITAHSTTKPLGTPLALNGSTGFTASGLAQGETVGSVTLDSAGAPVDAVVGTYAIAASDAVGGQGFDAANYDIQYVDGSLTVISPMNGGVIWREARAQTLPPHWQQSVASVQTASSGVPHLTLAPGFIRLDEDE